MPLRLLLHVFRRLDRYEILLIDELVWDFQLSEYDGDTFCACGESDSVKLENHCGVVDIRG